MGIKHTFRMACRAGGVAHAGGGVFVERFPGEIFVHRADPLLVGRRISKRCRGHMGGISQHDVAFDRRKPVCKFFQQRQKREIRHHDAILGMVDDPGDLFGKQPRIDSVIDRANSENAVPRFDVPPGIPGQRRDSVAERDAVAVEALGNLERPQSDRSVVGGVDRALDRARDYGAFGVVGRGVGDDAGGEERAVLHQSVHERPSQCFAAAPLAGTLRSDYAPIQYGKVCSGEASMKKISLFSAFTLATALAAEPAHAQTDAPAVIEKDPALAELLDPTAKLEKVAGGFGFTEGALWVPKGQGYLLFSEMPGNVIYKWTPDGKVSVYMEKCGYQGVDIWRVGFMQTNGKLKGEPAYEEFPMIGCNGLTLARQGRLVIATWGGRSIDRIETNGKRTVLADKFEGKRFGGTNDVVVKKDGTIYFTDGYGGLRLREDDPRKE